MSDLRPKPNQTEVDGVPVFWAESPEPFTGALMFRAGRADETLPTGGVTHVVEHLALFPFGRQPFEYNGRVEENRTILYASGRRDEVIDFLSRCARQVADLPLDRLEDEKRVLGVEAASGGGLYGQLLSYRYGACGYGLMAYLELGLRSLRGEDVADWSARYFTRGNAVAWLTGPPDGLSLPLPDGPRHPPPEAVTLEGLELPAQSWHDEPAVAVTFEGRRSTALRVAFAAAGERVHEQLRLQEGVTYSPGGAYHPLTADRVHVMLSSDCAERNAAPVRDGLLSIIDDLAANGPTEAEIEWDRSMVLRANADPRSVPMQLDQVAQRELIGGEEFDDARLMREHEALTPDAVATALRDMTDSMLLSLPRGTPQGTRSGLRDYDADSAVEQVSGVSFPTREQWHSAGLRGELTVGTEGLTYDPRTDSGKPVTFTFDGCVAAVEGQVRSMDLVSKTGSTVLICPDWFEDGELARETILERLPGGIVVPLDEAGLKVHAVAREKLADQRPTPFVTDLESLVRVLTPDEPLVNVADAVRTRYLGVLATTDRRLLFISGESDDFTEIPFDELRIVKVKGLRSKRLCVTVEGKYLEFSEISPRERVGELSDQLEAARVG